MNYQAHQDRFKFITVEGGQLAYIDEGTGPVILLIHGIPTSSWLYRHIISNLQEQGYRVIAPDLLGFGGSDKPKGYEVYSESKQGARIRELMNKLGIDDWIHVCHDGGGLWTWEMLKQETAGVRGLVILNTIIFEAGFQPPLRFEKGVWAKFYTWLYKADLTCKMMINATLNNGLSKTTRLSKEDKKGYWLPMQSGVNRALYYFFTQTCQALPDDYKELLPSLPFPSRVIWGLKDPMLKWMPQSEEIKERLTLSDQDILLLENAAHFIQEEKPEEIAAFIAAFAKEID